MAGERADHDVEVDDPNLLLPTLIDKRARETPDRLFCGVFQSLDANSLLKISYSKYANAINRVAWWIKETLGEGHGHPVFAYLGPPDILYNILSLAACKVGHQALLLSFRNSTTAHLRLVEATNCEVLIGSSSFPPLDPVLAAIAAGSKKSLKQFSIAGLSHWLEDERAPEYPLEVTLEQEPTRPFVILHTSGSTGHPKPIQYTFAALASYPKQLRPHKYVSDAPKNTTDVWKDKCCYNAFPPSHMIGALIAVAINIYWNAPPLLGPSTALPTPEFLADVFKLDLCEAGLLPPFMLQALAQKQEHLQSLSNLKILTFCGAPFPTPDIPNKIRALVPLYTAYGSTEVGVFALNLEDQADFEYMGFGPLTGAQFVPQGDGLFELVIKKDPKILPAQFVFHNFRDIDEYPTKDLFTKHPTKNMWQYHERSDDIIVLTTGQNIHPLPLEDAVIRHPKINAALLVGPTRPYCAWLIEPTEAPPDKDSAEKLRDEIWASIEEVNQDGPLHARVPKERILFTSPGKPMLRAGKGTVQRQLTWEAYKAEIDALYNAPG